MIRKGLARGLLALLMLPGAAFALGLGDIRLNSALNAPLDAEIELVNALPEDLTTLEAKIASRETFARYSLDWPAFLNSVTISKGKSASGRDVLQLRSSETITEPFLTVLVEASWARGRLVREYTVLLDPPVFAPNEQPPAPVAAPAAAPTAGAIERPAAASPATSAAPSGQRADSTDTYQVRRGDSLSAIARRLAPAAAVSTEQMMLGLYQYNGSAFEGDMNRLRAGVTLGIPSSDQLAAIAPTVAAAEVRRQAGAWSASSSDSGRLRLVTPTDGGVGAGSGGAPGTEALQSRVNELESKLAESQRLLELRNAELADLQAKLGGVPSTVTPPTAEPVPSEPPVAGTEPLPGEPATTGEAAEVQPVPGDTVVGEPPVAGTETPPADEPASVEPPVAATPVEPVAEPSFVDTLLQYWPALALLLVGLLGWLGFRKFKARQTESFDDRLGELAERNADNLSADFPPLKPTPDLRMQREAEHIEVEESGSHRQLDLPDEEAEPRGRSADDTISSDTAINLDQGDPIAEADFHMAYGLYDQAADLVKIALAREPERRDLKLKLLEVFFVWGNKDQFLTTARELTTTRESAPPGEWEKILIMGKQIAPEDELFSGAAASSAAGMDVDLNLDGGQGHIDFDPFDGAASGPGDAIDLDFGGALQDPEATGEADAEAAKSGGLDFAFPDGATPGGGDDKSGATTRQMTAKMAGGAPRGALESSEAPTVEQPALQGGDNPTIREKVELALKRKAPIDQTAELAIDDLGLDLGALEGTDAPGLDGPLDEALGEDTADANAPTMVAGLDDRSRNLMQEAADRAAKQQASTGAKGASGTWYLSESDMGGDIDPSKTLHAKNKAATDFDDDSFDTSATSRLDTIDPSKVDFELAKTGAHPTNGLDLDVGTDAKTPTMKTEQLQPEDLALPDLEPVTLSEVGTKLDLARAYVDMGDPDGARNILEEVLTEGSVSQKQEAQRLLDSLPG